MTGLFVPPNRIFVDLNNSESLIERIIVHEIKHYHNMPENLTESHDEFLALKEEEEYEGRYITRHVTRQLKEKVRKIFYGDDDQHVHDHCYRE